MNNVSALFRYNIIVPVQDTAKFQDIRITYLSKL